MTLEAFWIEYGELLLWGAVGGLFRWGVLKEKPLDGMVGVGLGAIVAVVFQPIAGQLLQGYVNFDMVPAGGTRSAAFLMGLAGVWPIHFYLDWARKRFEIRSGGNDQ